MYNFKSPGVYLYDPEKKYLKPETELLTGVPAFLGCTSKSYDPQDPNYLEDIALGSWPEFIDKFGEPKIGSFLPDAVYGFFENGGSLCYVISIDDPSEDALDEGLAVLASLDIIDLVCAPDIMMGRDVMDSTKRLEAIALQRKVLDHCKQCGDRFAILDSWYGASKADIRNQRLGLFEEFAGDTRPNEAKEEADLWKLSTAQRASHGALYFSWIGVSISAMNLTGLQGDESSGPDDLKYIPPCGHIAGVYARSDRRIGVHKAPANEILEGALDLQYGHLTNADQDDLNPFNINCLRAFPGRGIRIWGARTLLGSPSFKYINTKRLFLTVGRWIDRNMRHVAFELNDPRLWSLIEQELQIYFYDLFKRGALKGNSAKEAFYVKCDAETNPSEISDTGMVIAEVGLAPAVPNEFVVVRIVRSAGGTTIE